MTRYSLSFVAFLLFTMACSPAEPPKPAIAYPPTAKGDTVDDLHGTKVPDPYRWMEDLESKEVADWIAAQNGVTESFLATLPHRQTLATRLTTLWNYPRV